MPEGDGTARRPGRRRARGELAGEIFTVLEQAGVPLTAGEVRERIARPLAYTTVVTTMTRLYAKGALTRSREGRSHRYTPSTSQAGLVARRMRHVLADHDDRRAVLTHFVSELTDEDEEVLLGLLTEDDEHNEDTGPLRRRRPDPDR